MLCDPGFVFAGKRKTTIISAIHDVATTAIGRPYEKNSVVTVSFNGIAEYVQMPPDGKARVRSSDLQNA